jgi:hypothetical protein
MICCPGGQSREEYAPWDSSDGGYWEPVDTGSEGCQHVHERKETAGAEAIAAVGIHGFAATERVWITKSAKRL